MKPNLSKYANMKICVAVSGGKDSMALLHYIYSHAEEFGITLCALNCDHKMRGESSAKDSAFVIEWCSARKIPLTSFEWNFSGEKNETSARSFRLECYKKAVKATGSDAVATAHHLNDNAETVLFNLARGSSFSGLDGIADIEIPTEGGGGLKIIRPLIDCSREEIDEYVSENSIEYVEDESNFTDDYTRNKIRHNVLSELEKAVPGAVKAIYRLSRLVAENEEYFDNLIAERNIIKRTAYGVKIGLCKERAVFKRAAVKVIKEVYGRKDYTAEHAERLYNLQFTENGKKFEFLGLTAIKEKGGIVIFDSLQEAFDKEVLFYEYLKNKNSEFCGEPLLTGGVAGEGFKTLKFDLDCIPESAVIRFMGEGDFFKKFGGGTKSLGDFFTDKKIPVRLRKAIPLVANGSEILIVCGVEISEKVKVTDGTKKIGCLICADYANF